MSTVVDTIKQELADVAANQTTIHTALTALIAKVDALKNGGGASAEDLAGIQASLENLKGAQTADIATVQASEDADMTATATGSTEPPTTGNIS